MDDLERVIEGWRTAPSLWQDTVLAALIHEGERFTRAQVTAHEGGLTALENDCKNRAYGLKSAIRLLIGTIECDPFEELRAVKAELAELKALHAGNGDG